MSTSFMILGATDQKLWVFEVSRRSLGSQKTFYLFLQQRDTLLH
jgi:hypothetical protein